jgi:hypothetical protein
VSHTYFRKHIERHIYKVTTWHQHPCWCHLALQRVAATFVFFLWKSSAPDKDRRRPLALNDNDAAPCPPPRPLSPLKAWAGEACLLGLAEACLSALLTLAPAAPLLAPLSMPAWRKFWNVTSLVCICLLAMWHPIYLLLSYVDLRTEARSKGERGMRDAYR